MRLIRSVARIGAVAAVGAAMAGCCVLPPGYYHGGVHRGPGRVAPPPPPAYYYRGGQISPEGHTPALHTPTSASAVARGCGQPGTADPERLISRA